MKEAEFSHGWLKEQCDRIEAKATLVPRLEQRIADLEAQVAELTAALNDAYSRCPQLVTDASNSGDNRPRAAIDAARKQDA